MSVKLLNDNHTTVLEFWGLSQFAPPPPFSTAPSGQNERVYDQTVLSAAHPHPARPCSPQTAIVDPQDRSLPSATIAAQMPKGNDPVVTQCTKKISCKDAEISVESWIQPKERLMLQGTYKVYHLALSCIKESDQLRGIPWIPVVLGDWLIISEWRGGKCKSKLTRVTFTVLLYQLFVDKACTSMETMLYLKVLCSSNTNIFSQNHNKNTLFCNHDKHLSVITDRIEQRSVCVEHTSLNHHFSLIVAIKSFSFSFCCGSRQKGDDLSVVVPSNRLNKRMTGLKRAFSISK